MQVWATFWVHHRVFFTTLIKETLHHLLYTYWDILTEKLFRCNVLRYSVRHKNDRASEIQQTFYSANKIQKSMWHPLQECDVRVSGMASYITSPHTTFRRLPHKIASNYGGYTASQWKNWTLIYSLFCLKDLLPERHIICWQKFDMFSNHIQDWHCQCWIAFCKIWPKIWTVLWKEVCHP